MNRPTFNDPSAIAPLEIVIAA